MSSEVFADASSEPRLLQCMEIWGGNQVVESAVALSGLDVWVRSRPHAGDAGGGDIHYVSSCATGRINRLLLADVSGHGDSVAGIAVKLRDLMRRFVNHLDQTVFLRSLNREFAAITKVGRFATAVVTTYWSPTGALEICNAGHPRPLRYRARDRRWDLVPKERETRRDAGVVNVPLGVVDLTRYDTLRLRLEPDDAVVLYTDSLIESPGEDGELLGEEGLLERVRSLPPLPPEALIRELLGSVSEFRSGATADDDETVMVFRPNGRAPRWTVADRARSATRLLRAMADSLRHGGSPLPLPDFGVENIGGFFIGGLNARVRPGTEES